MAPQRGMKPSKGRQKGGEGEAKELEVLQSSLVPFLDEKGWCIMGGKDYRS